jgi:WD40 repeat protein
VKRIILPLLLLVIFMTACALGAAPAANTPDSAATSTALASAAGATVAAVQGGTATAEAALTAQAPTTAPAEPTSTAVPATPTQAPKPVPITVDNAADLDVLYTIQSADLRRIAFTRDGSLFAVSSGNDGNFGVKIYHADTGELYQSYDQYTGIVWDVAFSPDGKLMATAANDNAKQVVRVWRVADQAPVQVPAGLSVASSVAFSPDGRYLAVGGIVGFPNGTVWLYDTSNWTVKRKYVSSGQNVTTVKFFSDSASLAAGGTGGGIYTWFVNTGNLDKSFNGGKQANSIAISPVGSYASVLLASTTCSQDDTSGCTKGGVSVWNLQEMSQTAKFDDAAEAVDFSADGKLLTSASGVNDPNIRIRSTPNWALLKTVAGPAYAAAFAPNGLYLVTASHTTITVWGVKK